MGVYGGCVEDPVVVSPPGGQTNLGEDGETCGRQDMVIPPVVVALKVADLYPIQEYIHRWQATIAAQVACCPIFDTP